MLPYFKQPSLHLGPLTIHAFGLLVAMAIMLGTRLMHARARVLGLQARDVSMFVNWILVGGFLGAHLIDRFVYFPRDTLADPVSILRVWEGLSSFGGFVGGTAAALIFFWRHGNAAWAWKYVDAFTYAFPAAWILGRLGCTVSYDHPGRETRFVLGQTYRDGLIRHNLGLYEALYSVLLAAAVWVAVRRGERDRRLLGLLLVLYAPFRFAMDFLRLVDVRFLGLTPGQYGCFGLLAVGLVLYNRGPTTDPVA